jgi:hypothetical protein
MAVVALHMNEQVCGVHKLSCSCPRLSVRRRWLCSA